MWKYIPYLGRMLSLCTHLYATISGSEKEALPVLLELFSPFAWLKNLVKKNSLRLKMFSARLFSILQ